MTLATSFLSNIGQHHSVQHLFALLKWLFLILTALTMLVFKPSQVLLWRFPLYSYVLLLWFLLAAFISDDSSYNIEPDYALVIGLAISVWVSYRLARYFLSTQSQFDFINAIALLTRWMAYSSVLMMVIGVNWGRGVDTRFSGWVDNPNTLSMMLLFGFPIVLLRAIESPKYGVFSDRILVILIVILVFATGSRGALMAILISSLVVVGMHFRWRLLWLIAAVAGTMVLYLGVDVILQQLSELEVYHRPETAMLGGREEVWSLGLNLFAENPWLGYGYGSEGTLIKQNSFVLFMHQGNNFHNSYLSLLIHVGMLGLIPMALFLLNLLMRLGYSLFSFIHTERTDDFYIPLISICISGIAYSFTETWLFSPGNMNFLIFWTSAFLILGYEKEKKIIQNEVKNNLTQTQYLTVK